MTSDLPLAPPTAPRPILEIAGILGLRPGDIDTRGPAVAKVHLSAIGRLEAEAAAAGRRARYVLVTGITPTALGEGKTTTAIGLVQGLNRIGHRATICLRQPSLGQVFGLRGGAAGGGRCMVLPATELDLGLTGDSLAVAAAQDLAAAFLDNALHHGNPLGIDPRAVHLPRVTEVNDRVLRRAIVGIGGRENGLRRETEWVSTMASEVMAILALSSDLADLRARLGRMVLADSLSGRPITAEDLHVAGAMAVLLREAIQPNLLQTLEGGPALVHAGSFAHVAPGSSSVLADRLALAASEIVCTEAGYGADLGAEKFFDIKCRASGRAPDAVVIVATVRALKVHGDLAAAGSPSPGDRALEREAVAAVRRGAANLAAHVEIVRQFGVPVVVAVNLFPTDTAAEVQAIQEAAVVAGARAAVPSDHFARGGEGASELARTVWEVASRDPEPLRPLYPDGLSLREKIEIVAIRVYGASGVDFSATASRTLARFEEAGFGALAVCVAKTPYSLSSDASRVGRPSGFRVTVHDVRLAAGAGFVTPFLGGVRALPELPAHPRAERIDIEPGGEIVGLK